MSKEQSKFSTFMTAKKEAVDATAPATNETSEAKPRRSRKQRQPKEEEVPVLLHIPVSLLDRIDVIVGELPLKTSRRAWIMQKIFGAVGDAETLKEP
jgi:hypothetical protein